MNKINGKVSTEERNKDKRYLNISPELLKQLEEGLIEKRKIELKRGVSEFESIKIQLASSERIREWSYGEVKKPETINYRTLKPERDGLFCAKIFGPIKDFECLCGKYKRMKHRGVVCERCGVEVIQSSVRRSRMGHIVLATPVAHVWYLKSLPCRIALLLDLSQRELEKVLYYESFIVVDSGTTPFKIGTVMTEEEYQNALSAYGEDSLLVGMGGEGIREVLRQVDSGEHRDGIRKIIEEVKRSIAIGEGGSVKKKKMDRKLKVLEEFFRSPNKAESMLLDVLPVIPPELRPLVPLEGGRFASSDLNDLYRRVINRNNRLKRLQQLKAPEVIIRNEKRMLQESVDALFDNGRRGKAVVSNSKRPLKSLSDMLRGKYGRFRLNLLGKRVDYSGRTVIVVGPELKLHQCGLPRTMALELFKPFIYNRLEQRGIVTSIKSAKRIVEQAGSEVWEVLSEIVQEHPIMLNRAPTLHRMGIQSFEPILIEGKAIQLHPLVCTAFNADFDGDQMAVHIPLSIEAQLESRVLMLSSNNLISPASGKPIVVPSQDMVLGCYYMTADRACMEGAGMIFSNIAEARSAYDAGEVDIHSRVLIRINGKMYSTTIGRVLLSEILPQNIPFELINQNMSKKKLSELIDFCYRANGQDVTAEFVDRIKDLGFVEATRSGLSISIADMKIPKRKDVIIEQAQRETNFLDLYFREGLITEEERRVRVSNIWKVTADVVAKEMMKDIATERVFSLNGLESDVTSSFNPMFIMADSGARGSTQQLKQLAGMRGLMTKATGEVIETPVVANFREGLDLLQYFISSHGARKGLADTALRTANAGYLTRRLVDVSQDCIIVEFDCGTSEGLVKEAIVEKGEVVRTLREQILGRFAAVDIIHPLEQEVMMPSGTEFLDKQIDEILEAGIESVCVRSPITCRNLHGVCAMCYGWDLSKGKIIAMGEAIGILAAQSIGEPGTQLTMRTFHIGGIANIVISEAKPYIVEKGGFLSYNRVDAIEAEGGYRVVSHNGFIGVYDDVGSEIETCIAPYGSLIKMKEGSSVSPGETLLELDLETTPILSMNYGFVRFCGLRYGINIIERVDERAGGVIRHILEKDIGGIAPEMAIDEVLGDSTTEICRYTIPMGAYVLIHDGERVTPGKILVKVPNGVAEDENDLGGLPKIVELLEARAPKNSATLVRCSGIIKYGVDTKGKIVANVESEGGKTIAYDLTTSVGGDKSDGDVVMKGDSLTDGHPSPMDILAIYGIDAIINYLLDGVQEVYRSQGVRIDDKHVEVIIRQMIRKVQITAVGDSRFILGSIVDRRFLEMENAMIISEGGTPAKCEAVLLGITKAALASDSFISGASFQETTRVLTDAAMLAKIDYLKGIKENVIVGKLIPVGTGFSGYQQGHAEVYEEQDRSVEKIIFEEKGVDDLKKEGHNKVRGDE
ncbi:MAG: DNA-directed RNA polymerase subunit beta' [Deltaproteobacteria bacterium]|nr:MAG: DNA-directed RNA polymerase subunit beta' [Deltaproteobacteria bacterium]